MIWTGIGILIFLILAVIIDTRFFGLSECARLFEDDYVLYNVFL